MELSCASVGCTVPLLPTAEGRGEHGDDRGDSIERPSAEALLSLRGDIANLGGVFWGDRRLVWPHIRSAGVHGQRYRLLVDQTALPVH